MSNKYELSISDSISEEFLKELSKRKCKLESVFLLEKIENLRFFLLKDLEIDLDFDVVYPEGFKEMIEIDGENILLGGYIYLLKYIQNSGTDDEYLWYSAYKNIENISKEIALIDLESSL